MFPQTQPSRKEFAVVYFSSRNIFGLMITGCLVRTACDDPSSVMNLNLNGADLCQKIRQAARGPTAVPERKLA
jgi:hypothetical protein